MKKRNGTTLIEILLYSAITVGFILFLTVYYWQVSSGKVKNDSQAEVNDNANLITGEMITAIQNAKTIVAPATKGQTGTTLTLLMPDNSQTQFSLSSGRIYESKAGFGLAPISSQRVTVDNLTFSNLSRDNTLGAVRIQMQISRTNPSGNKDYDAKINIDSSAALRQN